MIEDAINKTTVTIEVLHEVLLSEGQLTIKPTGNSMGRLFKEADAVVIEAMPANALFVGAIIVFPRHNEWIAHRVVSRSGKRPNWRYRTCGDSASRLDDDIVLHDTSIGVIRKIKSGGRIINLGSPWYMITAYLRAKYSVVVAWYYA